MLFLPKSHENVQISFHSLDEVIWGYHDREDEGSQAIGGTNLPELALISGKMTVTIFFNRN